MPAAALAQAPAAPAASPNANIVVENPTYTTIPLEIDVNRPAAEVWARIGKYCDIAEWLQIPAGCKMLSGAEGEVGSVRSVANEVLVGKTQYSVHLHADGARRDAPTTSTTARSKPGRSPTRRRRSSTR